MKILFCGGCNPLYNRVLVYEKVKDLKINTTHLVPMQTFLAVKTLIQEILVLILETLEMALTHIQVQVVQVFQTFLIPYLEVLEDLLQNLAKVLVVLVVHLLKSLSQN